MKLLAWNVRGLSSPQKRAQIKSVILNYDPFIVILTETKTHSYNPLFVKSMWGKKEIKWAAKESSGSSGGILVLWDDLENSCINIHEESYTLSINFQSVKDPTW